MTRKPRVALIGAGAMGGALLKGWLDRRAIDPSGSAVFDPASPALPGGLALNPPLEDRFDVVVLAVKPQSLGATARYAPLAKSALVLSVLAGSGVASISSVLGTSRIVRAMPNLASMTGAGAAGLYSAPAVSPADRALAGALMAAVGAVVFVDDEAGLDAVTAISGSGPAYFFLMTEALEEAARALGLPAESARTLARQTLIGAGRVVETDARSAADLRKAVASPGGTTEAALAVLDGEGGTVKALIRRAAEAAFRRAGELKR